jgi:hypothetical protein
MTYLAASVAAVTEAAIVMVLGHDRQDRVMEKGSFQTRCVRRFEVHELVAVASSSFHDGGYHGASYLGFGEFRQSGVIYQGQPVFHGSTRVGTVCGFDGLHLPNHMNILIETDVQRNGRAIGLNLGSRVSFGAPL